jgi:hypothetical protein
MMEDQFYLKKKSWYESAEKFDYFMAGLAGAVLGYVAPTVKLQEVGFNGPTFELVSMFVFLLALVAGLKRIETLVHGVRLEAELEAYKDNPVFVDGISKIRPSVFKRAELSYRLRDRFLIVGFIVLIFAKLLGS